MGLNTSHKHASSRQRPNPLHGAATVALQLLLLLTTATPEAAGARQLLQTCSNAASPVIKLEGGSAFTAELSGKNNIKPGTTGVPAPLETKASGTFELLVDAEGKKAAWTLKLCDVPQYIASHLHSGSSKADYPPPLIPLEPYTRPADPFGPPELLPQLCPNFNIIGCAYSKGGSFVAGDIIALPGRDDEVPGVKIWDDFLKALKEGKIYINVHSLSAPAGLIRGNLHPATAEQVTIIVEKEEEKKKKEEAKPAEKKEEKKEEDKEDKGDDKKEEDKDDKEKKPIVSVDVNKCGPGVGVGVLGVDVAVGDLSAECPKSPTPLPGKGNNSNSSPSPSPSPSVSPSPSASPSPSPSPSPSSAPAVAAGSTGQPTSSPGIPTVPAATGSNSNTAAGSTGSTGQPTTGTNAGQAVPQQTAAQGTQQQQTNGVQPAAATITAPNVVPPANSNQAGTAPGSNSGSSGANQASGSSSNAGNTVRPAAVQSEVPQATRVQRVVDDDSRPRSAANGNAGRSNNAGNAGGAAASRCEGLAPGSAAYVRLGCGK